MGRPTDGGAFGPLSKRLRPPASRRAPRPRAASRRAGRRPQGGPHLGGTPRASCGPCRQGLPEPTRTAPTGRSDEVREGGVPASHERQGEAIAQARDVEPRPGRRDRPWIGSGAVAPARPLGPRTGERRTGRSGGGARPWPLRDATDAPRAPESGHRVRRCTRRSGARPARRGRSPAEGWFVAPPARRRAASSPVVYADLWLVKNPPAARDLAPGSAALRTAGTAPPRNSIIVSSRLICSLPVIAPATHRRPRPRPSRCHRPSLFAVLARSRWWQAMTG